MALPAEQVLPKSTSITVHGDVFWSLSGKPYFPLIFSTSNLKRPFHLVVPTKLHRFLPSRVVPTSLSCNGKRWEMIYHGERKYLKRIYSGWKAFIRDNKLKVGDGCVFELMACSDKKIEFRVQILRCTLPSEYQKEMTGENAEDAIILD